MRITVRRTRHDNPGLRWRWELVGSGMFGYAMTKRGATKAANRALSDVLTLLAGA